MINILIGIILWQLVMFITYRITKDDEEKTAMIGMGIFTLTIMFLSFVYKRIKLFYDKRTYNVYQFYGDVDSSHMESKADRHIHNYFMKPKIARLFRQVEKDEIPVNYSIRLLKEGKEFKSTVYTQDILSLKDIKNGRRGMSKEFIKKFLK